ncbi:hypothetical protein H4582DRAFT_535728 [Lactarius indigo]|nr:hypothetical protein H4582DRAFT_535728 [Lactarius indigo]
MSSKLHTGVPVVIRGIIGGVAAFLAIGAMALVVWRRQRQRHKRTSIGPSFLSEVMSQGTQVTVTPFDPTRPLTEVTPLDAGSPMPPQQLLAHRSSFPEASSLPLRHVVTVPVGLSSKELARLRSLPAANEPRSQPTDGRESTPLLTVATDTGELGGAAAGAVTSSSEALRLRLENNFLRHEIEQLHAERSEFPPSYASDRDTGVAS